ncbi:flagellar export protein FliJ [bacterium]|nr:flagellar export protein FliJ [bacterium]
MGFRFRFETLSRVRKNRQDMELQEISKAQLQELALENMKSQTLSKKERAVNDLMHKMDTGILAQEVDAYDNYFSFLEKEVALLEKQIAQALKLLEDKRQVLIKKQKECKAIERLRELDMDRYRAHEAGVEMRFIDEIAIQRHGRRS